MYATAGSRPDVPDSNGSMRTGIRNVGTIESKPAETMKLEISEPASPPPAIAGAGDAEVRRSAATAIATASARIAAFQRCPESWGAI